MRNFINRQRAIHAITGIAIFAIIAYFIITNETLVFDTVIREFIYNLRSDGLTAILKVLTYMGNWQTVTFICCLLLLIPQVRFSIGIPVSFSSILCTVIYKALKVSFHRARPDLSLHLIEQGGYSFPSGHSFTNFVFYGMIIFLCRQQIKNKRTANILTILLCCLIFLIGFSRIYLGVHYPTDVLGGWALGLCVLMILISGVLFLQREKK